MSKFEFGLNDPRAQKRRPLNTPTSLGDIPTTTLRNLWMAQYGTRAVLKEDLLEGIRNKEAEVAQELINRNLVSYEEHGRIDSEAREYYYVLEKEYADS